MQKGRDIVLDILESEGVTHIFGNPGTTELSLVDALKKRDSIEYVLGLQEATVVGMAEGYARATNRPAFVNLHATAGLGNGLGALSNAAYTNVPMVITAGQQDYRHIIDDPWLTGDLVGLAKPLTKWAHEVRSIDELGTILRRAFKDANTFPKGPVFVALPCNFMDEETAEPTPPKSTVHAAAIASGLEDLEAYLRKPKPEEIAIIAGDEISFSNALGEVVECAEKLGADVYGAPVHDGVVFPTKHPLWRGMLPPVASTIKAKLQNYKTIFLIGDRNFMAYVYSPDSPVPDDVTLLHLSADPETVAMTFATQCGLVGDIKNSLRKLLDDMEVPHAQSAKERIKGLALEKAKLGKPHITAMRQKFSRKPIQPVTAAFAIADSLPRGSVVVDEAPATMNHIRTYYRAEKRLEYNFSKGGGLGWAMPAAVGMSLARDKARTICLIGDGAAMYSPQALWTAAQLKLPITYIVINNTEYGVLKNYLRGNYPDKDNQEHFIGMDIIEPAIDYLALAKSMGVPASRLDNAAKIRSAINTAASQDGPSLIEISIAASEAIKS